MLRALKTIYITCFNFFFITQKRRTPNTVVNVTLPKNLSAADTKIFRKESTYTLNHLPSSIHNNIFITRSGIGLKQFRLIRETIHLLDEKLLHFYLYALWTYFTKKRILLNKNEQHLLIHNHWSTGYYHWMTESIPRLWKVRNDCDKMTLILPESYNAFQKESLMPFQFKQIIFIPSNKAIRANSILIPPNPENCGHYDPGVMKEIRKFYQEHARKMKITFNLGENIYISRANDQNRKIENEEEVIHLLNRFNFQVIYAEKHSFWEQVSIMSYARNLISIHGAGLTNLLFTNSGSSVLEFHKSLSKKADFYSSVYYTLASAVDVKYFYQFCESTKKTASIFNANLIVDLKQLEIILTQMIANRNSSLEPKSK